jgi:hypothetical protein
MPVHWLLFSLWRKGTCFHFCLWYKRERISNMINKINKKRRRSKNATSIWQKKEGDTNTERRTIPWGWKYNNIDCMYGETFYTLDKTLDNLIYTLELTPRTNQTSSCFDALCITSQVVLLRVYSIITSKPHGYFIYSMKKRFALLLYIKQEEQSFCYSPRPNFLSLKLNDTDLSNLTILCLYDPKIAFKSCMHYNCLITLTFFFINRHFLINGLIGGGDLGDMSTFLAYNVNAFLVIFQSISFSYICVYIIVWWRKGFSFEQWRTIKSHFIFSFFIFFFM